MKTSPSTGLLLAWFAVLLLTQCQNVTPKPPKAEGFDPPIPSPRSYLAGTITLPLRALEAKINRELDPVLVGKGSKKEGKRSLFPFSVVRSGSVRIQYSGQQVRFSAPLQVQLTKPFSSEATTPSKTPFCAMRVDFMSPLTLTPAWRLATRVKFVEYQWEIEPQIRLLGKSISLADFARDVIEKYRPSIEAAIDSAVYSDLRLDKMASPIWKNMQQPLQLDKQYGLWLLPKPIGIAASPITGDNKQITAPILITLDAKTALTPRKPAIQPSELPPLQKREQLPKTSDLRLMSFIPYAAINRIAAQTLRNKPINLALGSLTVESASVYGGQRSVIVKTKVRGLVDGTLYLRGRPAFDARTNTLFISNLDFDADTQDALSKLSGTVLHDALRNLLERILSVSLGNEMAQLPQKIDTAFEKSKAGKKTDLAIRSFRLVPQKIAVRPDGIQTLIFVKSDVAMQVQKL